MEIQDRMLVVVLVAGIGLHEGFHALIDGLSFCTNVDFVATVLSMESTWEPESWRALHSPAAAYVAYTLIWLAHAASAVLCLLASYQLATSSRAANADLRRRLSLAIAGIGIGAVLYFVGFTSIASAWFSLWQAPTPPNYEMNAQMLFLCFMAVLLYVTTLRRASTSV